MRTINLTTTQQQYEQLHQVADSKRNDVKVDRQHLLNLLIDHSVLVREARSGGIKVTEPAASTAPRTRTRL